MKDKTVIVLGGGLTGLAAAHKLNKAGFKVTVVEAQNRLGGLAASFKWHNFWLDLGPHKLYPQKKETEGFLFTVFKDKLIKHKKRAAVFLNGRLISQPPRISELYHLILPGVFSLSSYLKTSFTQRGKQPLSYKDYVIKNFGSYLYKTVLGPQVAKVWSDPDKLDVDLAKIRIPYRHLRHYLAAFFTSQTKQLNAPYFYYPQEGGIGRLATYLAQEIPEESFIYGQKPQAISLDKSEVTVTLPSGQIKADFLISTIDLAELLKLINLKAPDEVRQASMNLKFTSLIICYLLLNKEQLSAYHWITFPETKYCFSRLYEAKSFTKQESSQTVIGLEIGCELDKLYEKNDQTVFEQVAADLTKTKLIKMSDIKNFKIIRVKKAYPLLSLNYATKRQVVLNFLHSLPNLFCAGRSGCFIYNNMDHSLQMGLALAEHILSKKSPRAWQKKLNKFYFTRIID